MSGDWTLCIDFGTAYSKAAAAPVDAWARFNPSTVRPLMLGAHSEQSNAFLLDSAVFIDGDRIVFGREAIHRANAQSKGKRLALKSFKTVLGAPDLERALNANAPASIDPHRVFQMRDLVVLYLAYLLEAARHAISQDYIIAQASSLSYRYAAPAWRPDDVAAPHITVRQLFGDADALRASVGADLLSPGGLSVQAVSDLMSNASAARPLDMGLVFEATAAAAYTSIGLEDRVSHLIVVDMGAGTTDIAALEHTAAAANELTEARVTLKQAGDFIDSVIASAALKAATWARDTDAQSALWLTMMRQMREIKETIFAEGAATLRHEGRTITLSMRDIERDADFRDFVKVLQQAYDHSLSVVRRDAKARRRSRIDAVAVGGGAGAPFVQELFRARSSRASPSVAVRPATPNWAYASEFKGNLAPVFPQLAISIGGALAPDAMLAAFGEISPAGTGQSDNQPARG
ncbi:MAG: Hsp70 family protein [Hyphomonadaceae bacterium]|nr:Hsp70 family protein [Hyphomonadaceae bacterium]